MVRGLQSPRDLAARLQAVVVPRDRHQTIKDNGGRQTETERGHRLSAVRFDVTLSSCCVGPASARRQRLTLARAVFYSQPSGVRRRERSAAGNAIRVRGVLRTDGPKTAPRLRFRREGTGDDPECWTDPRRWIT